MVNSVDPGQTPQNAASDQDLQCLRMDNGPNRSLRAVFYFFIYFFFLPFDLILLNVYIIYFMRLLYRFSNKYYSLLFYFSFSLMFIVNGIRATSS